MFPLTDIYTIDRHLMAAYSLLLKEKEFRKFEEKFRKEAEETNATASKAVCLDLARRYSKLAGYCHELARHEAQFVRPEEATEPVAKGVLAMPEFKQLQDENDPFMLGDRE